MTDDIDTPPGSYDDKPAPLLAELIELRSLVREIDIIMRSPADALDRVKQIDFALMKRDEIVMRVRSGK